MNFYIELLLATCAITCITKLKGPVMSRSYVYLLFSGSKLASLHTTPWPGLSLGQVLGNPRCYPFLTLLYTLSRQHSELEHAHIRETLRRRTQGLGKQPSQSATLAASLCFKAEYSPQIAFRLRIHRFRFVSRRRSSVSLLNSGEPGTGQLSFSLQNSTPLP